MSDTAAPSCGLPADPGAAALPAPRRRWAHRGWGIDTTAAAVLRLIAGAWLLIDALLRWPTIGLLHDDRGALPRADFLAMQQPWAWTLHLATGDGVLHGVLALLTVICAMLMLAGWRARSAAVLGAALLVSWQHRTPLAALPGDGLLVLLVLISVLVPSSARLSLDAARHAPGGPSARCSDGGAIGAIVLVLSCGGAWWIADDHLAAVGAGVAAAGLLVPRRWWVLVPRLARRWLRRPAATVWLDGTCGICTASGRWLAEVHGGDLTLRTVQEDPRILALSEAHTSWVVQCNGQDLLGWQGIRAVWRSSPWWWPLWLGTAWWPASLHRWGDRLYAGISTNRHRPWWGWMAPLPAMAPLHPLLVLVALGLAASPWQVDAANATGLVGVRAPDWANAVISAPALRADGSVVDLRLAGAPPCSQAINPRAREFRSLRSEAHLARLIDSPAAARAYLRFLMNRAPAGITVRRAGLVVLEGPHAGRTIASRMMPDAPTAPTSTP